MGFSSYFSGFGVSPQVQLLHGQQCWGGGGSLIYPAGHRRKNELESFHFGDSDVSVNHCSITCGTTGPRLRGAGYREQWRRRDALTVVHRERHLPDLASIVRAVKKTLCKC